LEDIFLAAILQDIGVLAIDCAQADFYHALPLGASHDQLIAHEILILGTNHATLGAWLMRHWKLPESLCAIVEASHGPHLAVQATPLGVAARCVALGSECAEVLLAPQVPKNLQALAAHAEE
jgi:HD-like signal output (HDOD) protein